MTSYCFVVNEVQWEALESGEAKHQLIETFSTLNE